jgi:membrane-bound metal-dependent hydrolase YbcI (DUF457 family)
MQNRTHLAIGSFFMLLFFSNVVHKLTYVVTYLLASILPNLDVVLSGKKNSALLPLRLFFKPRGFFHSFTFCFAVTFVLVWFWPILAFPFFLGYSLHVLLDAWTPEGVLPFWPLRTRSSGKVEVGGRFESVLFVSFLVADILAAYFVFF